MPPEFENYEEILPPVQPSETGGNGRPYDDGVIKFLGWNNGHGYYITSAFGQVVSLAAAQHTKLQLIQLAGANYWSQNFPPTNKNSGSVDWDLAADSMIRRSQEVGVYDSKRIRGRGAWFDDGRSVVHAGDKLVLNGNQIDLDAIDSRYIYPLANAMDVTLEKPLPSSEAVKFMRICEMVRWEDPIASRLLAGWCFLAPICGAIDWRPHLWLTGPAGSGKSTVLTRIMRASLGGMFIHAAGDTTEAGLRQRLRADALPVLFDEFESEREKAAQKTQDVLSLVRQSSSDTGAEIIKGGANGQDDSYLIRSMFAFASISVNIKGQADESRLTVLSMRGSTDEERNDPEVQHHWIKFQRMISETLTHDYIQGLQARAIKMIPVIRQNIEAFSNAVAQSPALGGKRLGDQVGTLLAGAYSLHSSTPIDLEGALKWIASQDWSGVSNTDAEADELVCITRITSHMVRAEGRLIAQTLTIAELIDIACKIEIGSDNIDSITADEILQRYGLRCVEDGGVWEVRIATVHRELEKILHGTGYQGWGRILLRLDGAKKCGTTRFAKVPSRAISVPLSVVRKDGEIF